MSPAAREVARLTRAHEAWQRPFFRPVEAALREKRRRMARDPVAFLRGAAHLWPAQARAAGLPEEPRLLTTCDLHIENFGTWRDAEGRQVWGINDLDEASEGPFGTDLLRLAASALLEEERKPGRLGSDPIGHILAGYRERIGEGRPRPFVLEDRHPVLRDLAALDGAGSAAWWRKLDRDKAIRPEPVPQAARDLLLSLLPPGAVPHRIGPREAGLGSRERPRFAAIAEWNGGWIAREIKAAAPSALRTGEAGLDPLADHIRLDALARAVRDPFLRLTGGWIGRRLSPESDKIELDRLEADRDHPEAILTAMGGETANLHLIAAGPDLPRTALATLGEGDDRLREAAAAAARAVRQDHAAFREALDEGLLD
ncbi:DUF2252 family protein [Muricoccus radiodurans]|uniref:DUF2252 family protein n=1 Tax=Muricoccus radiodurans TaxID=2231721 RepID=UPI003CEBC99C